MMMSEEMKKGGLMSFNITLCAVSFVVVYRFLIQVPFFYFGSILNICRSFNTEHSPMAKQVFSATFLCNFFGVNMHSTLNFAALIPPACRLTPIKWTSSKEFHLFVPAAGFLCVFVIFCTTASDVHKPVSRESANATNLACLFV